jgi:hypothetical protein
VVCLHHQGFNVLPQALHFLFHIPMSLSRFLSGMMRL